ncbi:hypothetical protein [Streptomyces albogriseolus]|uniref:hypothetical protein n=1 Tax=Streptomyces albogriseolus TaxID=1887 RepID=UPI003460DFD5
MQADGLGTVTQTVESFGGFAKQYEQIEKVSAHHCNFWEVLLCGQIGRDLALMFDLAEKLEFTATSEDGRVLDTLAHAQRNEAARNSLLTNAVIFHNALTSPRSSVSCSKQGGRSTPRTWPTSRRT